MREDLVSVCMPNVFICTPICMCEVFMLVCAAIVRCIPYSLETHNYKINPPGVALGRPPQTPIIKRGQTCNVSRSIIIPQYIALTSNKSNYVNILHNETLFPVLGFYKPI